MKSTSKKSKENDSATEAMAFISKADYLEKRIALLKELLRSKKIKVTLWPDKGGALCEGEILFSQDYLKKMVRVELFNIKHQFQPLKKIWETSKRAVTYRTK